MFLKTPGKLPYKFMEWILSPSKITPHENRIGFYFYFFCSYRDIWYLILELFWQYVFFVYNGNATIINAF